MYQCRPLLRDALGAVSWGMHSSAVVIQLPRSPWFTALWNVSSSLRCLAIASPTKQGIQHLQEGRYLGSSWLPSLYPRVGRETLALLGPQAEIPMGRKFSSLVPSAQPHSSFPKQGISSFYFSLCPSPGPAGCYFGLNTPMSAFF